MTFLKTYFSVNKYSCDVLYVFFKKKYKRKNYLRENNIEKRQKRQYVTVVEV